MRLMTRRGQGIVEYLLAIAVILLAIIAGVAGIRTQLRDAVYGDKDKGAVSQLYKAVAKIK